MTTGSSLLSRERSPPTSRALTVTELARLLRDTLHGNPLLSRVLVRGETGNVQALASGRVFFTLRDAGAQIACVLFPPDAEDLGFDLEDGMDVLASGDVDLFTRRGEVQLVVRGIMPAGVGAFWASYQRTRKKLAAEGLFDAGRKRPLPTFPRRIGVVTSEVGAAVHDILTILRRRFPIAEVVVAPALVQGPEAPASLRRALAAVADRVDVVILARGGGSLEDLWCFNDEGLARAVAACRVPVVSAIGHETDVTVADFVADVRAATPSAAAEIVSPDLREIGASVLEAGRSLLRGMHEILGAARSQVRGLGERLSPRGLRRGVEANRSLLERVRASLAALGPREVGRHRDRLDAIGRRLDVLSPFATLRRGYAIAERQDGHVVAHAADVTSGDALAVRFQDGRIQVRVRGGATEA
ncbi:MAG: exodeoxyribonuclease VII large subunit [Thermoplasmata archaeon]